MGSYNKYDPRLESLVMETRTIFDPEIEKEIEKLDAEVDKRAGRDVNTKDAIARAMHLEPEKAATIAYERTHTGFTREITVTRADLERLYTEVATVDAEVDRQAGKDVDTKGALRSALA